MEQGFEKGELCNRNGCAGIIDEHSSDGSCSCHINPPCSHCVDDRHYCPVCDWQGIDDQHAHGTTSMADIAYYQEQNKKHTEHRQKVKDEINGKAKPTQIDFYTESHTHFSMKYFISYPKDTPTDEIKKAVGADKNYFGGRWERISDTGCAYIKYTD